MTLARSTTWSPGDLLASADLNGEFNNIINNPISLVSPTTGAINFNLSSHRSLVPAAITATSGTAGQALVVSGTEAVWGAPTVATSNLSIVTGSTGQVLAVTSSNSAPAFQVIPPDGGLSTTVPSTGMLYYASTAGKLVGLTIGTSGQVLTVSTASKPSWETPTASAGGGGGAPSTASDAVYFRDDFFNLRSTHSLLNEYVTTTSARATVIGSLLNPAWSDPGIGGTPLSFAQHNFAIGVLAVFSTLVAGAYGLAKQVDNALVGGLSTAAGLLSTHHYQYTVRMAQHSTGPGGGMIGMGSTSITVTRTTAAATAGIYLAYKSSGANVFAVGFTSSAGAAQLDLGVTATAAHTYVMNVTSSAISVSVDGSLIGSITSSAISGSPLTPEINVEASGAGNQGVIIDYLDIQTTAANRTATL